MRGELRTPGEPFKRLFIALPCTEQQCRAIGKWRSTLGITRGRPVPAANFHLTLMFLGEVGVSRLPALCDAMAAVPRPEGPLRLELDRLVAWHRADALVLEPAQTPVALRQWVYALQQALLPLGVEDSVREFRAHLTLVRDYPGDVPETPEPPAFRLNIDDFVLFESSGGRYKPIAQWPLA
ncbi:RNA 2',3'-cyclic phosphodiesterase [Pseudomonas sp. B21-036]|uniref:RNA 2',3'-cyclic phosphodiesterase n=1 Tax=unclassified Pseudomonas TaxID=196821 RepID=UPI002160EEB5|nr:RNA 2',3'-cyclic phosphodiesterase [Pseudomonas sp. B21-036]UVL49030.1 RNA 2',3'-cyclic phosphodiesterase [Pseudomonas sp. B21-036]